MLPFSYYSDRNVQSVYVPDDQGGRLYVALAQCKFCFCTPGDTPIKWHSDLPFVPYDHLLLNHFAEYTLMVYGSNLVVIGGTLIGQPINLVWSLSSKRNEWEKLPSMLTKRSSVMAVSYSTVGGDHLVAAGGKCGDKICVDVEVFDGKDWTKVKPLPMDLKSPNELTSVLHTDKKWYIMEANGQNKLRTTYSAPIEDIISDSPTCEWKKHSAESSPPPSRLPPISFEGQLIVVGSHNHYEKAKLYFHSPVTNSWVSIENAPHIGNVVGIANLSHSKSLVLIYNESGKYTVKMVTQKGNQL